jgi:O-antigen/teichoic acid export membrane protein
MARQIKLNILSKVLLSVFNIAIPILIGPYILRVLDIDLYTEFSKATSLLAWFLPFAIFGVNTYGLREISRSRTDRIKVNILFLDFFIINMILSIIVAIIYITIAAFYKHYFLIYLIISSEILFSFFGVEYVNEAFENYGFILYKNVALRLIYLVLIFLFVKESHHIIRFVLISAGYAIVNNLLGFCYVKRFISFVRPNLEHAKNTFKNLVPILILTNSSMLYTTLDRLFLSLFVDSYDITYYSISQNILLTILNVFLSVILVSIPRLTFYYSNKKETEYEDLQKKSAALFYLCVIPSCIGISLLADQIMFLYGGIKYSNAGPVLSIFSIRYILFAIDSVASKQILFVAGKEQLLTKIFFIGGGINIIGNTLLLCFGKLSAVNVILTTMICDIVVIAFEQYNIYKINRKYISTYKIVMKYFAVSAVLFFFIIKRLVPMYFSIDELYNISNLFSFVGISVIVCIVSFFLVLFILRDKMFLYFCRTIKEALFHRLKIIF